MEKLLFRCLFSFFMTLLLSVSLTSELSGLSSEAVEIDVKGVRGKVVEFPCRLVVGGSEKDGRFVSPESIEIDSWGNLYVIDSHGATLRKLNPEGRLLWEINGREWGGDGFLVPRSIGVSSGLNLYLLDVGRREIFRLSDRGEILGVVLAGHSANPRAIALTETGKLVVYDGSITELSVIAPTGNVLWSFRPEGFRSRSHVGMAVMDEEEICLYTQGSKSLRFYHFMGGLKRVWKPTLPHGGRLKVSSVDFGDDERAFILDNDIPGLFIFDALGNLLFDISETLEVMGFKGPGEVRRWGDAIYVADVRGGQVFVVEIPPHTF